MDKRFPLVDDEVKESCVIQELALRGYMHIASPSLYVHQKNGMWIRSIGDYRLTLIHLDRHPDVAPEEDALETVGFRLSCSHPLYDRRGTLAFLVTSPGLRSVRETNYIGDVRLPRRYSYLPHKEQRCLVFGIDGVVDLSSRVESLAQFIARCSEVSSE